MLSSNLPPNAKGRFASVHFEVLPNNLSKPQRPFPETSSKCILNNDDDFGFRTEPPKVLCFEGTRLGEAKF